MFVTCDICKKNKAIIRINGSTNYCYACHNAMMLESFGEVDTYQYPGEISVVDDNGENHTLKINHLILGSIVQWEATEVGGGYHFREISELGDSGYLVAKRFFDKITHGICTKSIGPNGIKSKGVMEIVEDDDSPVGISFVIDGKKFLPNEVAELFKGYPGFNILFQINDPSQNLLNKDEYLVPVTISKESLVEELNIALAVTTTHGFISYKTVNAFAELFYKIYDKLEIMTKYGDVDETLSTAREMARILYETPSDDDCFPYDRIEEICQLADPYHTDTGLWGYLEAE